MFCSNTNDVHASHITRALTHPFQGNYDIKVRSSYNNVYVCVKCMCVSYRVKR